jgi:DnaJ homolog subfamily C member 19
MTKFILFAALIVAAFLFVSGQLKAGRNRLSLAEARDVLGLPVDADAAAVRAAHRRIVTLVHPDKGGSAELTARVNAARDALLASLKDHA